METVLEGSKQARYPSGNYARWFIEAIIDELEGGAQRADILLKYDIRPGTLDEWVRQHASAEYRNKRKMPTALVRSSIVRAVLSGRMTMEEAKAACNVKIDRTIKIWIRDYQLQENVDLAAINSSQLAKKESTTNGIADHQQVAVLQEQLAEEKLKVAALNTLIDVAEEKLKIAIRKKPGARQS